MPVHDWTRVAAGIFHDFHNEWCGRIKARLNAGVLPEDYYAMLEQAAVGVEGDVLTLQDRSDGPPEQTEGGGGTMLATAPKTRFVAVLGRLTPRKKNTVAVRHVSDDRVVAVIEIVSPGNKESRSGFRAFLDKTVDLLAKGVHLLIADLFPPSARDPHGIHAAVLDEITGEEFTPPSRRAADTGGLRGGSTAEGVHRAGEGGGRAARHAGVLEARPVRNVATGGDVRVGVRGRPEAMATGDRGRAGLTRLARPGVTSPRTCRVPLPSRRRGSWSRSAPVSPRRRP